KIQYGVLISGALYRLELLRFLPLLFDLLQKRRELAKTEILAIALLPSEQAENVRILYHEYRIPVGNRRIEHCIGEPLHGRELTTAFQPHLLLTVNNQQRVAGNGIERFAATAH